MKISDSKSLPQSLDKAAGKPPARNGASAAAAPAAGEPIQLSAMSGQLSALETQLSASPAFDSAKVDAIKQAIVALCDVGSHLDAPGLPSAA